MLKGKRAIDIISVLFRKISVLSWKLFNRTMSNPNSGGFKEWFRVRSNLSHVFLQNLASCNRLRGRSGRTWICEHGLQVVPYFVDVLAKYSNTRANSMQLSNNRFSVFSGSFP